MHHLSALSSGYPQAAGGTARIYARGTQTRVTYYTDFEASSSASTDVVLNSYGQAEVYVDQVVDVWLYSSSGAFLKTVTVGSKASAVEIISPSLNGTDYTTAVTARNKPTTVEDAFDLWYTLAGNAVFPYVNPFNTGALSLSEAIGEGQNGEFSVKKYGAVGDGSTNDTAAIANAILAATANDGGVLVFPPGTYRTTLATTIPTGVSVRGCGGEVSVLSIDSATEHAIVFSGTSAVFMHGMGVIPAQSNTGTLVRVTGGTLNMSACSLGQADPSLVAGSFFTESGGLITARGCQFGAIAVSSISALAGATTGVVTITAPTRPASGRGGMLVVVTVVQGTGSFTPLCGEMPMPRIGVNTNTTVGVHVWALPDFIATTPGATLISVPDHSTDVVGFAFWLEGCDYGYAVQNTVVTDSSATSVTSSSISTVRPGGIVIDFMANDDETDTGTPGASQVELADGSAGSATVSVQSSYKLMAAAGATTMSWTALTNAANKAHIAIAFERRNDH